MAYRIKVSQCLRNEQKRCQPPWARLAEAPPAWQVAGRCRAATHSTSCGRKQYEERDGNPLIALLQRCCGTANIDHGTTAQSERDPGGYLGKLWSLEWESRLGGDR